MHSIKLSVGKIGKIVATTFKLRCRKRITYISIRRTHSSHSDGTSLHITHSVIIKEEGKITLNTLAWLLFKTPAGTPIYVKYTR